jgi:hypothetical protein
MKKIITIRLRESIVKRHPNITSSLGNDLIISYLKIQSAVMIEFERLNPKIQEAITKAMIEIKIPENVSLRIATSILLDGVDTYNTELTPVIEGMLLRIGEGGLLALYHSIQLEQNS